MAFEAPTTPEPRRRPDLRLIPASPAATPELFSARAAALAVATALVFGVLVRCSYILSAPFPLNDGGMFYAMSRDLQDNAFRIPDFTTYNFDTIPFVYPPLAFYAAALTDRLTPLSMFDTLRVVPLTTSIAAMCAFAALARRMLGRRESFVAAVFAFALVPRGFEWMIMGGGLTRSFGLLFALLALHEAHRLYHDKSRAAAVSFGVLAGLTALSHLEMAWFLAFSSLLFFAADGRHRTGIAGSLGAALIAVTLASPWWITVLARHGIDPIVAAMTTGSPGQANPVVIFLVFQPTGEAMFAIIAGLALLGIAACLSRGHWLLPAWVLACGLLDPRGFGNVGSAPIALLTGIAIGELLLPMLLRADLPQPPARRWLLPGTVLGFLFFYALINAMIATPGLLTALPRDERAAIAWLRDNTPTESEVLVVTDESWAIDRSSEWLPVLAERRSVATVQGYEWIRGAFSDQLQAYRDVQACADADAACIDAWSSSTGITFDYIYMPKTAELEQKGVSKHPDECCAALRASLRADDRYEAVLDTDAATVFKRQQ